MWPSLLANALMWFLFLKASLMDPGFLPETVRNMIEPLDRVNNRELTPKRGRETHTIVHIHTQFNTCIITHTLYEDILYVWAHTHPTPPPLSCTHSFSEINWNSLSRCFLVQCILPTFYPCTLCCVNRWYILTPPSWICRWYSFILSLVLLLQAVHCEGWRQGKNPLLRLCHTCHIVRPLRTKHCRVSTVA